MTERTAGISTACVLNTPEGLAPLGWLKTDDLVETKDHGFQPIQSIDRVPTGPAMQIDGVEGCVLAGQHMLVRGWAVELYLGIDEALAIAGDVSILSSARPDQTYAQITMNTPMLIRVSDIWIESHGNDAALHRVLTPQEVRLTSRAFGCLLARDSLTPPIATPPNWTDVSSTFGSRSAAA